MILKPAYILIQYKSVPNDFPSKGQDIQILWGWYIHELYYIYLSYLLNGDYAN